MRCTSTHDRHHIVDFAEAVDRGIAPDGGLYMPCNLPALSGHLLRRLHRLSFPETALEATRLLLGATIPGSATDKIVSEAFTFPVRLHPLTDDLSVLELFHGPTLAFKDFGARFLARVMSWLHRNDSREITVLVATSGDTGGAVAGGFSGVTGMRVVLLYPADGISRIQELQLTTGGENVTALRVRGTFDDCQRLVKKVFADRELAKRGGLTSANSINIGRLLPQMFYYLWASHQAVAGEEEVVFFVPSGNLGNLTAGLMARETGIGAQRFVAATNANDVFPEYVRTGIYAPRASIRTLSNAMDVGDPGNLQRIRWMFHDNVDEIRNVVSTSSCSDGETRAAVAGAWERHRYAFDPHGAVGYHAALRYRHPGTQPARRIIVATAHPAKFPEVLPDRVRSSVVVPPALEKLEQMPRRVVEVPADYDAIRELVSPR